MKLTWTQRALAQFYNWRPTRTSAGLHPQVNSGSLRSRGQHPLYLGRPPPATAGCRDAPVVQGGGDAIQAPGAGSPDFFDHGHDQAGAFPGLEGPGHRTGLRAPPAGLGREVGRALGFQAQAGPPLLVGR